MVEMVSWRDSCFLFLILFYFVVQLGYGIPEVGTYEQCDQVHLVSVELGCLGRILPFFLKFYLTLQVSHATTSQR